MRHLSFEGVAFHGPDRKISITVDFGFTHPEWRLVEVNILTAGVELLPQGRIPHLEKTILNCVQMLGHSDGHRRPGNDPRGAEQVVRDQIILLEQIADFLYEGREIHAVYRELIHSLREGVANSLSNWRPEETAQVAARS